MMTITQREVTVGEITLGYVNNDEQTFAHPISVSLSTTRKNSRPSSQRYCTATH